MPEIELQAIDRLRITTLMDNYVTLLLKDTPLVERHGWRSIKSPLAGHGLSLLVETWRGTEKQTVLLDPGYPRQGVLYNWEIMGFHPDLVETVVLSHGHFDHTEALPDFLARHNGQPQVVLHPYALDQREKRAEIKVEGQTVHLPKLLSGDEMEAQGAQVVVTDEPYVVAPGLMSTGQVPRVTEFEGQWHEGQWRTDETWDDQALVANLAGRGLVIMAGCAHAGIINTVLHAQAATGIESVYAVLGGFHLPRASQERLEATTAHFRDWGVELLVPTHCTGFDAQRFFAEALPEAFCLNAVGSRYTLNRV